MKYNYSNEVIPQDKRSEINRKILMLLNKDLHTVGIDAEKIYQAYTGSGGLHGLERKSYDSFHDYTAAKKEIEQGQFFTPPPLAEKVVACLPISGGDTIADLTCGAGAFFNFLPVEANLYGCELDAKAVAVARYLYPQASIVEGDIQYYRPGIKFDMIIGNPPFNLRWGSSSSQAVFMERSADLLLPGGILAVITPNAFLSDEFHEKSVIEFLNENFSFLGQSRIEKDAFKAMGVKSFATKVMFFQRSIEGVAKKPFSVKAFMPFDPITIRTHVISPAVGVKHSSRLTIRKMVGAHASNNWSFKNRAGNEEDGYSFQIKKLMYEMKSHPACRVAYRKAFALVQKFVTQQRPNQVSESEWEERKLTQEKLSKKLRVLFQSAINPDKRAKLPLEVIKMSYGFKVVANDPGIAKQLEADRIPSFIPMYSLVTGTPLLRHKLLIPYLSKYSRLIRRKRALLLMQGMEFSRTTPNRSKVHFLADDYTFVNKDMNCYHLNSSQANDIALLLEKPFGGILSWQQGSGKSVSTFGGVLLEQSKFKNVILVGPPIAIEMTWLPFFERMDHDHIVIRSRADVERIAPGQLVVIPLTKVVENKKVLQRFMRRISNKALLVFDESDEITNYNSKRSQAMRDVFRRTKTKWLTTGTTTRNNLGELYGQLELIFNNSYCFIDQNDIIYNEISTTKKGQAISPRTNPHVGKPFDAYFGNGRFKAAFSPVKATVLGIGKANQDIYNSANLEAIIKSTILTRKFRDIVGPDKYEIFTHQVRQQQWETDFYLKVMEEFGAIIHLYYASTGNARKDAALRILRQLNLLIQACSTPHLLTGVTTDPAKASKIVQMVGERNTKIMVGCLRRSAATYYKSLIESHFPDRKVFYISGDNSVFKKRQTIIDEFEATDNGILVCTQKALSSSVSIPTCQEVILESLNWNLPRMEQFYFRAIRYTSTNKANVYFVIYENTIEVNLMTLLLDKERLNDFVKTNEFRSMDQVLGDFQLSQSFLDMLLRKETDDEGKVKVSWGKQKIHYENAP